MKLKSLYKFCCKKNIFIILFFAFVAVATHAAFLGQLFGSEEIRIFTSMDDELSQMISMTSLLENNLDSHNPYWSFSYGLGGDTYSEMAYYYSTSPLFYIRYFIKSIFGATGAAVFEQLEWKLVFNILRQFFVMLSMYLLLRQEKKEKYTAVIGALVYGSFLWFVHYSYRFSFMTEPLVWPPLFMIALNRYINKKSFIPLVCMIALTIINSFYFGFISCVLYATIFLVFAAYKKCTIKEYFSNLAVYLGLSLLGVLAASFAFLPAVNGLLSAERSSTCVVPGLFPNLMGLFKLPLRLSSHGLLSFPLIIFFAAVLIPRNTARLTRLKSILALFWIFAYLSPVMLSAMNGFSYPTDRWYYVIVFAIAYTLPDWIEEIVKHKAVTGRAFAAFLYFLFIVYASEKVLNNRHTVMLIFFAASVMSLIALALIQKKHFIKSMQIFLVLLVAVPNLCSIYDHCRDNYTPVKYSDEYAQSLMVGSSPQRLTAQKLRSDNTGDFYRVDDMSTYGTGYRLENRSFLNRNYTISAYCSEISGNLHHWIKKTHDVCVFYDGPSFYHGFGNRLFLENAWGVKYKINDISGFVPYGYSAIDLGEGSFSAENQYSVGIDLWYSSVLSPEEFESMDYAQRDAVLLQAAQTADTVNSYPKAELDEVTAYIPLDPSKFILSDCEFDGKNLKAGKNAEIQIPLESNGAGEYLLSLIMKSNTDSDFTMTVNGSSFKRFSSDYPYSFNTDEFSFHADGSADKISFKITEGTYTVENMRLAFNSYSQLAKWTENVNKYNLENLIVDGEDVSGTIKNDENGILTLNIPFNKGWSCKVDGKKVPLVEVNGVFTGIELEAGQHEIELHFTPPYLILGVFLSVVAVGITIALTLVKNKKSREQ